MDQIEYAGNTLITGSEIAHAVLAYAQALASNGDSATISIPILNNHGSVVTAELLIGPASQLIAEPYETDAAEIEDADVVRQLNQAAAKLQTPRAVTEDAGDMSVVDTSDLNEAASSMDQ